jgi:hypothetical protein
MEIVDPAVLPTWTNEPFFEDMAGVIHAASVVLLELLWLSSTANSVRLARSRFGWFGACKLGFNEAAIIAAMHTVGRRRKDFALVRESRLTFGFVIQY